MTTRTRTLLVTERWSSARRANEKRERAESLPLNGKRVGEWFRQVDCEATADQEAVVIKRARMHPLGPDAQDLRQAVQTLQVPREELSHCLSDYARFMQALDVASVGEN